ncbi:dephospho-CoA kinase [Bacillota bacterium Meth-B3]|nr:dephospho-CoA kinase [Christensenellaceae bacterium]MEA5070208.1 dephospho-CoA kinase [Christensenellaceae bacterium]
MTARDKAIRLGLTGGVGCGKSTAAAHLKALGAHVVDADEIARALTAEDGEALDAIRARFGDAVFGPDGALDRRALGDRVFADVGERRALEAILHPAIQRKMLSEIDEADREGASVVVLDVPLLFETGFDALCDEVWVVTASREQQALRVMARDRLTRAEAEARILSQMPLAEKEARADRVISTGRPIDEVRAELKRLYRELTRRR